MYSLLRLRAPLTLAAALVRLACADPAWAQAPASRANSEPPLLARPGAPANEAANASLWRREWPTFRTSEGIATVAAGLATLAIVLIGPVEQPRWQGPILFDEAVRNQLRVSDPGTRRTYRTIGDYTYKLSPVVPFFDALIVATVGHSDAKLAYNLTAMSLEAYSYAGLTAFVTTELSARGRPPCGEGGECDTQSFFSGHAAIAATGAGLVCANHTRMALYGSPLADLTICALASANALVTATTRVIADRHYATDVLLGTGIGFGFGYGVPVLLHYSHVSSGRSLAFGPDPACGGNCLGVRGTF